MKIIHNKSALPGLPGTPGSSGLSGPKGKQGDRGLDSMPAGNSMFGLKGIK